MVILATGDGKGKTTAAIGQAIRALGRDRKVFFCQFIKSEGYASGEDEILRGFGERLKFIKGGKGFVGILGDTLPREEHAAAARATLALAKEAAASGEYGLVVMDEANVATSLGLISPEDLLEVVDSVAPDCDIVITGRGADPALMARAEMVTECVEIKHPFREKAPAKKGLEY
jgi:cob(I)alamin adenosyltransferase